MHVNLDARQSDVPSERFHSLLLADLQARHSRQKIYTHAESANYGKLALGQTLRKLPRFRYLPNHSSKSSPQVRSIHPADPHGVTWTVNDIFRGDAPPTAGWWSSGRLLAIVCGCQVGNGRKPPTNASS